MILRALFSRSHLVALLLFCASATVAVTANLSAQDVDPKIQAKLDKGVEDLEEEYHIFVRMKDQVFKNAKSFDAFCKKNQNTKRSKLKKQVVSRLKKKSNASWKKIEALLTLMDGSLVEAEEGEGEGEEEEEEEEGVAPIIFDLKRYWLVNGFACRATGQACHNIAAHQDVAFVYINPLFAILPAMHREDLIVPRKRAGGFWGRLRRGHKDRVETALPIWKKARNQRFDPKGLEVPWNLESIGVERVWKQERITGKGILVGVMDTGLILAPSLLAALWRNPKEKFNEKDSDGNGYVDDLFGYDFLFHHGISIGDMLAPNHGSICAGIVAGRPLKVGKDRTIVTGIAPDSRIMVLRGLGQLPAYEYALEQGVDIMSMSFGYVKMELGNWRGIYRLAFDHLTAAGMVLVVAAGNSGPDSRLPPDTGKQIALPGDIPCVITVGGVLEKNELAKASSQGPCYWDDVKFYEDYPKTNPLKKPDVTAYYGGFPCFMTIHEGLQSIPSIKVIHHLDDATGLVSGPQGTSFSCPHAAGVAALMLSANKELPAFRVKELMVQTCKDLGKKGWDPQFGNGLLQALEAVQAAKKARKKLR